MKPSYPIIIALFILMFCAPVSAQRWSLTATIPETDLHSVQLIFPDSLHGYLFGWKPLKFTTPTYEDAVMYRTIDGGVTWQNIDLRIILGSDTSLYSVNDGNRSSLQFNVASANSCVVSNAGQSTSAIQDSLTFYWSRNNGTSWSPTRTTPVTFSSKYLIEGATHEHEITALTVNNYIEGLPTSGQFEVSATNGAIFDDIRWDSTLLNNIVVGRFHGVASHTFDFFDDVTWIVTVSDRFNFGGIKNPYTLVTLLAKDLDSDADPGTYWEEYKNTITDFPSDPEAKYFDSHCVRGTESVYLFSGYGGEGQYPFYGINYLYSSDQGRTWNADSSFVKNSLSYRRAITASTPSEVWSSVIPSYATIFPNTPAIWIAHSTDFGKTWNIDSSSLRVGETKYYDGRNITFSDKNHGWMFAQLVGGQNSAIFRYINTNNAVEERNKESKLGFTIYPNPAGIESTIRSINNIEIASIDIYDVLGIKRPCSYKIRSEESSASIRTNALPVGNYYVRIKYTNGISVIPFVVQH